jgi:hypothetical protein
MVRQVLRLVTSFDPDRDPGPTIEDERLPDLAEALHEKSHRTSSGSDDDAPVHALHA